MCSNFDTFLDPYLLKFQRHYSFHFMQYSLCFTHVFISLSFPFYFFFWGGQKLFFNTDFHLFTFAYNTKLLT